MFVGDGPLDGKGMFGDKVHQEVVNNGELKSGITVHLVNENYDEGKIIFQDVVKKCSQPTYSS